jgi:hypothetical protein
VPRLRPSVRVGVLGAGSLLAASLLGASATMAQTVGDNALLSPTLQGDPNHPSRFRKVQGRAMAETGPGQIRDFGYRPGFGAGSTGYDSSNDPRRKAPPRRSAKSAATPATTSPATSSAASIPQNGVLPPSRRSPRKGAPLVTSGTEPLPVFAAPRRKAPPEQDPFQPTGIRTGSMILRPAIELSGGYNSNPSSVPGGRGSSVYVLSPELTARSDWSRHELSANLRGSYTGYGESFVPALDRPNADMKVNGRIDASSLSQVNLEGRFLLGTENPGSPNLPAGLAKLPVFTTFGATAGYTQRFNRFELTAKETFDRTTYQDSLLTDGTTASNADRAFNQYGTQLRGSYELTPGVKPFVGLDFDRRLHDLALDRSGFDRSSRGITPRVGTSFEFSSKLTGEASIGYVSRTYDDPALPKTQGPAVDAALIWTASALTTATLTAKTTVGESTLPGVSGSFTHDYLLQVDHSFRRWLLGSLKLGYGTDSYVGLDRFDQRYSAAAALVYKLNRELQLKSEVRQDWLQSNVSGVSYTASSILFGVRLQR